MAVVDKVLVSLRARPEAAARILCFPWAGGGVSAFHSWLALLPPRFDLGVVRLPGRESRISEAPFTTIFEASRAVAQSLGAWDAKPMVFFGHSLGALLAFETAIHLEAVLGHALKLVVVSGSAAPGHARSAPTIPCPPAAQSDRAWSVITRGLRADLAMADSYGRQPRPAVSVPIVAYAGRADGGLDPGALGEWRRYSRRDVDIRWFDGGHFFVREHPEVVMHQLALDVDDAIGAGSRLPPHD